MKALIRSAVLAASLIASLVFSPASPAKNKNHERAQHATFVLYGRSAERGIDHHALCTAFAYKKALDGYILMTAGHCFTPGAPEDATYVVADGQVSDNPVLQPVEVLNHIDDGNMDVAKLHLKTTKKYEILELDTKAPKIDDKVFYVGYPEITVQTVFTGRVASDRIESIGPDPNDPCDLCKNRILIQTGGGGGASGSPIISEKTGKVIGILEGHIFENGVVIVPTSLINGYYLAKGHNQIKNAQSGKGEN